MRAFQLVLFTLPAASFRWLVLVVSISTMTTVAICFQDILAWMDVEFNSISCFAFYSNYNDSMFRLTNRSNTAGIKSRLH